MITYPVIARGEIVSISTTNMQMVSGLQLAEMFLLWEQLLCEVQKTHSADSGLRWALSLPCFLTWDLPYPSLGPRLFLFSSSVVSNSFVTPMDWVVYQVPLSTGSSYLGKITGVGCHFLLEGIFPTQESLPSIPDYKNKGFGLKPLPTHRTSDSAKPLLL